MDISCINLTKPLIKESEKLLKNNIFTYWKDDTHWNKHGISIAAKIASQVITESNIR